LAGSNLYKVENAHKSIIHSVISVGDKVWACSSDKTISIWSKEDNKMEHVKTLEGHSSRVFCLATNHKLVWSGGWDTLGVMVWSAEKMEFLGRLSDGHKDAVNTLQYKIVDGKKYLFSGSSDRSVIIWTERNEQTKSKSPRRSTFQLGILRRLQGSISHVNQSYYISNKMLSHQQNQLNKVLEQNKSKRKAKSRRITVFIESPKHNKPKKLKKSKSWSNLNFVNDLLIIENNKKEIVESQIQRRQRRKAMRVGLELHKKTITNINYIKKKMKMKSHGEIEFNKKTL